MRVVPQTAVSSVNLFSAVLLRLFLHNTEKPPYKYDIFNHTPVLLAFLEGIFINVYLITLGSVKYVHHVSLDHLKALSFQKVIFLCSPCLVDTFYTHNQSIILVDFCKKFRTKFSGFTRHILKPSNHPAHVLAILLSEFSDNLSFRNQFIQFYDSSHGSFFRLIDYKRHYLRQVFQDRDFVCFSNTFFGSDLRETANLSQIVKIDMNFNFNTTESLFRVHRVCSFLCPCGILFTCQNEFCNHLKSCRSKGKFNVTREKHFVNVED